VFSSSFVGRLESLVALCETSDQLWRSISYHGGTVNKTEPGKTPRMTLGDRVERTKVETENSSAATLTHKQTLEGIFCSCQHGDVLVYYWLASAGMRRMLN
jgi:hypothetical protein